MPCFEGSIKLGQHDHKTNHLTTHDSVFMRVQDTQCRLPTEFRARLHPTHTSHLARIAATMELAFGPTQEVKVKLALVPVPEAGLGSRVWAAGHVMCNLLASEAPQTPPSAPVNSDITEAMSVLE
eukprot:1193649-Prorocentrum_minimum.AAC.4